MYSLFGYVGWYDAYYLFPAFFSVLQCVCCCFISKDFDGDAQLIIDMDIRTRLRYNMKQIREGLA